MSAKNLQELGASPFPYIVPVLPLPLLEELVKGEHFVLTNLLKSILVSSSQVGFTQEPQAEITEGALVSFVRLKQSPLVVHDPKPAPQEAKKKKGKIKASGAGFEGFVEWVDPIASDPAEEMEDDMSSLTTGFLVWMRKWAARAQGETTPDFEVSGRKHSRRSGRDEEAEKSLAVITVDSPKRASDALPALKGAVDESKTHLILSPFFMCILWLKVQF